MGNDGSETAIWLGAGASYGSQCNNIEGRPPVTGSFFADPSVQRLLQSYPVLHALWEVFEKPDDLEDFWQRLDVGYNSPERLPACDISRLATRLRDSPSLPCADDARKTYYTAFVGKLPSQPTVETYRRAVAVAGWEIKHLLVKLLDRRHYDLTLHEQLFKTIEEPFAVLTFNYDTIAEQALEKQGFGRRYEPAENCGQIFVSKPHGSIQWEWRKFPHEFVQGPTLHDVGSYGVMFGQSRGRFTREPLLVGLRTKRELVGQDSSDAVNCFWEARLAEAKDLLTSAGRVIVIGFSFQEADSYLRDRLSAKQIGSRKRILLCDRKTDDDAKDLLSTTLKRFFDTDDVTPHWSGFDSSFIGALNTWKVQA